MNFKHTKVYIPIMLTILNLYFMNYIFYAFNTMMIFSFGIFIAIMFGFAMMFVCTAKSKRSRR